MFYGQYLCLVPISSGYDQSLDLTVAAGVLSVFKKY